MQETGSLLPCLRVLWLEPMRTAATKRPPGIASACNWLAAEQHCPAHMIFGKVCEPKPTYAPIQLAKHDQYSFYR